MNPPHSTVVNIMAALLLTSTMLIGMNVADITRDMGISPMYRLYPLLACYVIWLTLIVRHDRRKRGSR